MKNCAQLEDFLETVDLDACIVHVPTDGLFVCGGDVPDEAVPLRSLRHTFLVQQRIPQLRVALAEEVFRRLSRFSQQYDLLAVESHIAFLTRTILLFSESPGSIAELGAFSVLKECARKLCIVLDREHAEPGSFIYDGLIAHMCNAVDDMPNDSKQIQVFDWPKKPKCDFRPSCGATIFDFEAVDCGGNITVLCDHLAQEIKAPLKPATHQLFGKKENEVAHLALLIVDLIRIARCADRADIAWMLKIIGKPITGLGSKRELDYLLTLVEVLGFVTAYPLGRPFYCANIKSPTISYAYKKGTKVRSFDPCMQATYEYLMKVPEVSTHRKAYERHCLSTTEAEEL